LTVTLPRLQTALLAIIMLILTGCSSLTVQETWKSSSITAAKPFKKVLVININLDENVRKMYEDVVAAELGDNGVKAVAGHSHVKITKNYTHEDVKTAATRTGCDAVLTTRGLESGNQKLSQKGEGSVAPGEGWLPSSWDPMIATMQVSLYGIETNQLVWSATIKTSDADNKFHVSRDMGNTIFKLLREAGLL